MAQVPSTTADDLSEFIGLKRSALLSPCVLEGGISDMQGTGCVLDHDISCVSMH